MSLVAVSVLDEAGEALGGFLPRLGGALLLLILGVLAARLVGGAVAKALAKARADDFAARHGVSGATERAGLGRELSTLVGRALRIALTLVAVFAALSLLGLQFLDESLNAAVLFLPNLIAAGALVLAGVVLGVLIRERGDRLAGQMDLPIPLGRAAQVVVVAVFAITAAAQVAVSTAILMALVGIVLSGIVATVAISFGLGGQGLARELTAGRYVRGAFEPGQTIAFGDVEGEVVIVETAATVLRTSGGETVRVPNDLLLSSIVTVHSQDSVSS